MPRKPTSRGSNQAESEEDCKSPVASVIRIAGDGVVANSFGVIHAVNAVSFSELLGGMDDDDAYRVTSCAGMLLSLVCAMICSGDGFIPRF